MEKPKPPNGETAPSSNWCWRYEVKASRSSAQWEQEWQVLLEHLLTAFISKTRDKLIVPVTKRRCCSQVLMPLSLKGFCTSLCRGHISREAQGLRGQPLPICASVCLGVALGMSPFFFVPKPTGRRGAVLSQSMRFAVPFHELAWAEGAS